MLVASFFSDLCERKVVGQRNSLLVQKLLLLLGELEVRGRLQQQQESVLKVSRSRFSNQLSHGQKCLVRFSPGRHQDWEDPGLRQSERRRWRRLRAARSPHTSLRTEPESSTRLQETGSDGDDTMVMFRPDDTSEATESPRDCAPRDCAPRPHRARWR